MPLSRRRAAASLVLLALAWCASGARAQQDGRFRNVVNKRFATVSDGPQSSLIVDAPAGASEAAVLDQVRTRVRADWRARATAASGQIAQLRRAGLLKGRSVLPVSTLVTLRQNGRLVIPPRARTRALGGGALTFTYNGFSAREEQVLRQLQQSLYPRIVAVYGEPAWSGNVVVQSLGAFDGGTGTDVQRLAFGAYDVSGGRILLPVYENVESQTQAFLLMLVHAFHGPATFAYDAWEQGFARAAASVVVRQDATAAAPIGLTDASANNLLSLLKFYDVLNQPALGNPTFFPPSQAGIPIDGQFTIAKMLYPRLGMSGAVWLKVFVENPNFFRDFNRAYYAAFDQPGLAGNVPALRGIAAGLLPNGVEGLPWNVWYERQFVLDTSASPGAKLYAFTIPSEAGTENDQSASITLVYFRTKAGGDEDLLGGRAYATYFDGTGARINLGAASEQAQVTAGEGFLTTLEFRTQGIDAGSATVDVHVGTETARTYIPSGFRGDFQGVVLGVSTGSVSVQQNLIFPAAGQTRSGGGALENGGFGANVGAANNDLAVSVVEVTRDTGEKQTFRLNTGDGQYYAILRADGGVQTLTKTFAVAQVPYLISLPVRPLATSAPAALGLPASDFLLSFWDPLKPGGAGYQTFGGGGSSVAPLTTGRGYWLKAAPAAGNSILLSVNGTVPPRNTDVTVSTPFGWSLIGTPFVEGAAVRDLLVQYLQNDAIPWEDAVARNLVVAEPYGFTPQAGYFPLPVRDGRMEQWQGYWVRVLVPSGVTILVPGPDSPTRARTVAPGREEVAGEGAPARAAWSVRLHARGQSTDAPAARVTLGAAPGASRAFDNAWDREAPPLIVPGVDVSFADRASKSAGGRFVADFRGEAARGETWDMAVSSPQGGTTTLSWDGVGTVPRRTRLVLVDKTTGVKTFLRGRSSYTFTSAAGQTRAFQIVAEAERTLPLAISDVIVQRTRAAGGVSALSIGYAVSDAAEVRVEVQALGGRTMRRLGGGRTQSAGRQNVTWDGRDEGGAPVPAGAYTLTIVARGDDGTPARQSRQILMVR